MNETTQVTKLTKKDLENIETEVQMLVGEMPTIENETTLLNHALDFIAGAGQVLTLATVELVQAFGAVALAVLFIVLEADRVYHGVLKIGQHEQQALLIAVTLTAMNAVLPIYALRNVNHQDKITRQRWTVRGYLVAFWNRLTARPQRYEVDVHHNPALAIAETAITWSTLFLAFYAVLGTMLAQHSGATWYAAFWRLLTQSNINQALELAAGLLLSVGGVFGVQSISHELATRLLIERPQSRESRIEQQRQAYQERVEKARQDVQARYMAAKLADQQRKAQPVNFPEPPMTEADTKPAPTMHMNGAGKSKV